MTTERLREIAQLITERCSCPIQESCELCSMGAPELRAHADELDRVRDAALEDAAEIADKHAEHSGNAHGKRYTCGEDIAAGIRALKTKIH